jgi:hypothetical protein
MIQELRNQRRLISLSFGASLIFLLFTLIHKKSLTILFMLCAHSKPVNLGSNWNSCISHCERYECCFENRACDMTEQHCSDNAFCKGFFDNGDTSEASAVESFDPLEPSSSSSVEGTWSEAKLEEMCAPSMLGDNWNLCISYCEPYECCFTGSNSCDKSKTQCGDFSICAQFFSPLVPVVSNTGLETGTSASGEPEDTNQNDGPSYIQYTAVELAQACNSQQLSKDDSDCKKLCKGSACKYFFA